MVSTLVLIDETLFTIILVALIIALFLNFILILILAKYGPQARRLGKAHMFKRATALAVNEAGQATIEVGKIESSGHLKVSANRAYELLHTGNPTLNKKCHWKGGGVPLFVADARKAVAVSPEVLVAAEVVEMKKCGVTVPKKYEEWAKNVNVTIPVENKKKSTKDKIVTKLRTYSLLALSPLKLSSYLNEALDMDAQDVLMDKQYQAGFRAAGKQYMKMGLVIGLCVIVGLVMLGVMVLAGGGV